MTTIEILKLYISDVKNLIPDSPAKTSRLIQLEKELDLSQRIDDQIVKALVDAKCENTTK